MLKPYYDQDGITIFHGDCREILPQLPKVDLVLTDPPYGIADGPTVTSDRANRNREKGIGCRAGDINTWHPESDWDKSFPSNECECIGKYASTVAWFGNWKKRELAATHIGLPMRAEIVWKKDMHVGPPCPLAMQDERIWLFSEKGINGRHFETSVWDEPVIPTWKYKHHKNEKPIGLMKRLVRFLTDEGQTILDPFMGSGTTLVAAKQLGRKAIGIEIEQKYVDTAIERLRQKVLQFE